MKIKVAIGAVLLGLVLLFGAVAFAGCPATSSCPIDGNAGWLTGSERTNIDDVVVAVQFTDGEHKWWKDCTGDDASYYVALLASRARTTKPKPKQGICHTCKCGSKADKCIRYCGAKNICVIACADQCRHAKIMKRLGIKQCPMPSRPSTGESAS